MMVTLVVSPVMMLPTMRFLIIQVQLATKKIKSLVTKLTVARTTMLVSLLIQKIGQMILVSFIYDYRISGLYRKFRYIFIKTPLIRANYVDARKTLFITIY